MPIRLKSVKYWELEGQPKQWTLDGLTLGPINLIVGPNATGKTRCLNLIWNFARLFVPELKFRVENGGYEFLFEGGGEQLRYVLDVVAGKVTKEELSVGEETLLTRGQGGEGQILFAQEQRKRIRFKPPENELAAVARRDSLQHPFLESLHEWALAVRHYTFGTGLGREHVALAVLGAPEANERDPNQVVGIFRKAVKDLGPRFKEALIKDLAEIHYDVEEIAVSPSAAIKIIGEGLPGDVFVLGVKERGIDGIIEQQELSQGMFRVLSILIQVNYSQMANRANCILIDDVGEGLDFERSSRLIRLLMRKAKQSRFQLIMTTNDQFVMNDVPLEYWSVLKRNNNRVRVHNYDNSRETFEEFKFVGLSNFSFLEMDFVNGPPKEAEPAAHE